MSNISDAQDLAATNAAADAADDNAGSFGTTAPISDTSKASPAAVTFVSGTSKVVNAATDCLLYITIKTAAALKIEIGPTSAVANQISPSQSSALGTTSIRVPKGWYVKLTGTMANLDCLQVPC